MHNWAQQLQHLLKEHSNVVMVTVAETKGSTPREAGTKFFVLDNAIVGTIGGGNLEYQATKIARDLLKDAQQVTQQITQHRKKQLKNFSLAAGLGMCCGGVVELIFEVLDKADASWLNQWLECAENQQPSILITYLNEKNKSKKIITKHEWLKTTKTCSPLLLSHIKKALNDEEHKGHLLKSQHDLCYIETFVEPNNHLYLLGAGHVGKAIVKLMQDLPWKISWIESRDNYLQPSFIKQLNNNVNCCITDTPEAEIAQAKKGCYFLVMTHDHALDLVLCEQILKKEDALYFGVIGSQTKRKRFEHRLAAKGFDQRQLDQMVCPIGIDGINSKEASLIAISVVAQLLQKADKISPKKSITKTNFKAFKEVI